MQNALRLKSLAHYLNCLTNMRLFELTNKPRSVATKQAIATKRMYGTEKRLLEKIWDLKRPRNIKVLQATLDMLWKYFGGRPSRKPELRFGPGTKFHGRYLSYNDNTGKGGQYIELAPGERNFYVLLHELAHALGPEQHGLKFAQIYHELLKHDSFQDMIASPEGELFLHYLDVEHPYWVRRAYRNK